MGKPVEPDLTISRWTPEHPRWNEMLSLPSEDINIDPKRQDYHLEIYTLVALMDDRVVGVLRFWTQEIGIDEDQPVMQFRGQPAIEAKTVTFYVLAKYRRQGIATQLQLEELRWAKELGLYQVRSRSDYDKTGNHGLKIALGFGVNPGRHDSRGKDGSAYFVIPLQMDEQVEEIINA